MSRETNSSRTEWSVMAVFPLTLYILWLESTSELHFIFSGERMLEEFHNHLDKEEERRDNAEDKLQRSSKILVSVKAGVEHLADKLYHLKAVGISLFHFMYKSLTL